MHNFIDKYSAAFMLIFSDLRCVIFLLKNCWLNQQLIFWLDYFNPYSLIIIFNHHRLLFMKNVFMGNIFNGNNWEVFWTLGRATNEIRRVWNFFSSDFKYLQFHNINKKNEEIPKMRIISKINIESDAVTKTYFNRNLRLFVLIQY